MFLTIFLIINMVQIDTIIVYTKLPLKNNINSEFMPLVEKTYNRMNPDKIFFIYKDLNDFKKAFKLFEESKDNHHMLYINGVTITKERKKKFDFSIPYFPIRPAAVAPKYKNMVGINVYDKKYSIAARINTSNMKYAEEISKKTGQVLIRINTNDSLDSFFRSNKVDLYITDAIAPWLQEDLQLIHIYKEVDANGYGILYPKGSKLKKKLDKTIKHILSSPDYFKIIKKVIPKINYRYFERVKY
jgi:hypothetical protein